MNSFIEDKLKLINEDPEKQKLLEKIITEIKNADRDFIIDDNILATIILAIIYNEENQSNIDITKYLNENNELEITKNRLEDVDSRSILIEMNKGMNLMTWYNILNKSLITNCNVNERPPNIINFDDTHKIPCESKYNKEKKEEKKRKLEEGAKIIKISEQIGYSIINDMLTSVKIKYNDESEQMVYIFDLKKMKTLNEFKTMSEELYNSQISISKRAIIFCELNDQTENKPITSDEELTQIIKNIFEKKINGATFKINDPEPEPNVSEDEKEEEEPPD